MATLDLQVGANLDDVYEAEGTGTVTDSTVASILISNTAAGSRYWFGLRWVDSSLSQSDTINVSYISIYAYNSAVDDANGNLHFQLVAAPATFTAGTGNYDVTNRSRTVASASWVANDLAPTPDVWVNSPSVVTPLQEVVDAYTPTAFVVIGRPNSDVAKSLYFRSYNFDTTLAPKFHIEYTAGGAARRMAVIG